MSVVLLVVAMVTAVNPFRSRLGLRSEPVAMTPLVVGVAAGLGGVALLAVLAPDLLSALQITPETFLIAGGLVAIVAGARSLFFPAHSTSRRCPDGVKGCGRSPSRGSCHRRSWSLRSLWFHNGERAPRSPRWRWVSVHSHFWRESRSPVGRSVCSWLAAQ